MNGRFLRSQEEAADADASRAGLLHANRAPPPLVSRSAALALTATGKVERRNDRFLSEMQPHELRISEAALLREVGAHTVIAGTAACYRQLLPLGVVNRNQKKAGLFTHMGF